MCSCNQSPCTCCPPKESEAKKTLREAFTCACSTAAGAGLGHLGCALSLLFSAAASTTASALGFVGGAALTGGGIFLWHKLRGKKASPMEKKFVYGGAALGLIFSAYMHFGREGGHHHHHTPVQACPTPDYVSPGEAWFERQDSSTKVMITNNAKWTGQSLEAYLDGLCVETAAPRAPFPAIK